MHEPMQNGPDRGGVVTATAKATVAETANRLAAQKPSWVALRLAELAAAPLEFSSAMSRRVASRRERLQRPRGLTAKRGFAPRADRPVATHRLRFGYVSEKLRMRSPVNRVVSRLH